MSIHSREQALSILGIDNRSDDKKIREAYHELLKEYHPDNQPDDKTIYKYYSVVEAYDFLTKGQEEIYPTKGSYSSVYKAGSSDINVNSNGRTKYGRNVNSDGKINYNGNTNYDRSAEPRILGNSEALLQNSLRKKAREERERYERTNGNGREKRLHEMIEEGKKLREIEDDEKRKQESVDRALKSIKAILASRIIEEYLEEDSDVSKNKADK